MTYSSDLEPQGQSSGGLEVAGLNRAYRRPLIAYFLRRTGDHAEAEDMTQEVFLRTLRAPRDQVVESPDAFIFKIASNLVRDRARRRISRHADKHLSLDAPADPDADVAPLEIPAEDSSAERVLIDRERLQHAMAALELLPERTREIFIQFRLESTPQATIAARLGISVSAVEKHVVRAVMHLARHVR